MFKKFVFLCSVILFITACNGNKSENDSKAIVLVDSIIQDSTTLQDSLSAVDSTDSLEESFETVAQAVIEAYRKKDNAAMNTYIAPEYGLYIIYRPGALDEYVHVKAFDFNKPIPSYYTYHDIRSEKKVRFEKVPAFDCGSERWNKTGLYSDLKTRPNRLSMIATFMNEILEKKITKKEIQHLKNLESISRFIVLTGDEKHDPFVFQLSKKDGKWFLTLIDRAYGSCDA